MRTHMPVDTDTHTNTHIIGILGREKREREEERRERGGEEREGEERGGERRRGEERGGEGRGGEEKGCGEGGGDSEDSGLAWELQCSAMREKSGDEK